MEKSAFLSELKKELRYKLPGKEVRSLLQEYGRYYDTAAEELGSPALIATEILSDQSLGLLARKQTRNRLIAAVLLLAVSFGFFILPPHFGKDWLFPKDGEIVSLLSVGFLLVLLPLLLCLLTGWGVEPRPGRGMVWLVFADIGMLLGCCAYWYSFNELLVYMLIYPNEGYPNNLIPSFWARLPVDKMSLLMGYVLLGLAVVTVLLTLLCLFVIVRGQQLAIPLVFLNCGVLCGLCEYTLLLRRMMSFDEYLSKMTALLTHMAVGVIIAAIVFILLSLARRRGESE